MELIRKTAKRLICIMIFLPLLAIAAQAPKPNPIDPYENFNRNVFQFNYNIGKYTLLPIVYVYHKATPKIVKKGIHNFFLNLYMIPTVINDLLQANIYQATSDSWRFMVNSSVGLGGFIDVASNIGLPEHKQDFGLTLGHYGYHDTSFLVIPFVGSSSVRDLLAFPVDHYTSPYQLIKPLPVNYGLYALDILDDRTLLIEKLQQNKKAASKDAYAFIRDDYIHSRNLLIAQNRKITFTYYEKHLRDADQNYFLDS